MDTALEADRVLMAQQMDPDVSILILMDTALEAVHNN